MERYLDRIGVRTLKEQASEILRRVREDGESFEVTCRGRVIALVIPVIEPGDNTSLPAFRRGWDQLGEEISAQWPRDVSAVDAIGEGRRDL